MKTLQKSKWFCWLIMLLLCSRVTQLIFSDGTVPNWKQLSDFCLCQSGTLLIHLFRCNFLTKPRP